MILCNNNYLILVPKIDIVRSEADADDILVFSESWLNTNISNDKLHIENFIPPLRTDRVDRISGGVVMYVRNCITCKRRAEFRGVEAVWVELYVKCKKILAGVFYKPPNCTINYFDLMKQSIDRACYTSISDIIITGDFNFNMTLNVPSKMPELILEYNLTQLISEPTHVTEHSSSILDLILVRNKNNVLLSGVADPFIPNQIRHYSPVIVLLKFTRPITKSFKRRIWYYQLADYENTDSNFLNATSTKKHN